MSSDNTDTSGCLFEISGGWAAQTRWQRAGGHGFPHTKPYTPEDAVAKWSVITNFGSVLSLVSPQSWKADQFHQMMVVQRTLRPRQRRYNPWSKTLTTRVMNRQRQNCSPLDQFTLPFALFCYYSMNNSCMQLKASPIWPLRRVFVTKERADKIYDRNKKITMRLVCKVEMINDKPRIKKKRQPKSIKENR